MDTYPELVGEPQPNRMSTEPLPRGMSTGPGVHEVFVS